MVKLIALVAFAALGVLPDAASAEVIRHAGAAQSPILGGVTVTGGATLAILSGQVPPPLDPSRPASGVEGYGDTRTQAIGVFHKIEGQLAQQGFRLGDVVKLTVFLVGDPKKGGQLDFKGFSDAYAQFFGTEAQPNKVARSVVQVSALANPAFLVEIEAIAAK